MGKWDTGRKRNHHGVRVSGKTETAPPGFSGAITDGTAKSGAWWTGQRTDGPYLAQGSGHRHGHRLTDTPLNPGYALTSYINSALLFSFLDCKMRMVSVL